MAELVYSAGLTSKLFWLQESRKTAGYILDGYSKADIRKIAWEDSDPLLLPQNQVSSPHIRDAHYS